MEDRDFQELLEGVREMKAIERGERKAVRVTRFSEPDVAALRAQFGVSQREFAALLAINIRTLQDWEQGRRSPRGPARVLLNVVERYPRAVIETVHGKMPVKSKARSERKKMAKKTAAKERQTRLTA